MYIKPRYLPAGDQAIVVEFGNQICIDTNRKVYGLLSALHNRGVSGIIEMVPTYRSLLVYYQPDVLPWKLLLQELENAIGVLAGPEGRDWEIPTLYGGEAGPDLVEVAEYCGLKPQEIIDLHSKGEYRVYMLGFTPGYPYLGGMDHRIAVPRLKTPRTETPAGSVGIAGNQTGIYPVTSPGGWRIIGRTPLKLFDPLRQPPVLVQSGDTIRFVPITEERYQQLKEAVECETAALAALHETADAGGTPFFEVIRPGLLTTVQDLGRVGYQAYGVPVAGAMDRFSLRIANILVGNPEGEAALEITVFGPRLEVVCDGVVAVTGGDLGAALDGKPMPQWEAVPVKAGSVISFAGPRQGCRSYLAVAGGIAVPEIMDSKSTYLRGKFGGLYGRQLQAGDLLRIGPPRSKKEWAKRGGIPRNLLSPLVHPGEVRVVLGPQDDYFDQEAIHTFLSSEYMIKPESDRMGYRLEGPLVKPKEADIISDGIPLGAIQIPADGSPIILLADRQTTGGYPKIATVISPDIGKLAQAKPGDRLVFRQVTMEEANSLYCQEEKVIARIKQLVGYV
ncbi:MAG: 5-oxoprolinase subunit PxpB [Bacillota bacterium]